MGSALQFGTHDRSWRAELPILAASWRSGDRSLTRTVFLRSILGMKMPASVAPCKAGLILWLVGCVVPIAARADWQRDSNSISWLDGTNVVWRFCFDTNRGKPFFHPLSVRGGPALTNFKPEDHPWHYGLWFSWKYINKANYWEEDRRTGRAEGATRWTEPIIETRADGSARIALELEYVHPSGRVDLTEKRQISVSAPGPDGGYTIDWASEFTAGPEGAVLDRTPMPGEPGGQINGGYAGLSLRVAGPPFRASFVCTTGLVTRFEHDRARPSAAALACNLADGTNCVGGVAILSDPGNGWDNPPWYIVNSTVMRFLCAAILAPKPMALSPGAKLALRYRVIVRPKAWTPETLRATHAEWMVTKRFQRVRGAVR